MTAAKALGTLDSRLVREAGTHIIGQVFQSLASDSLPEVRTALVRNAFSIGVQFGAHELACDPDHCVVREAIFKIGAKGRSMDSPGDHNLRKRLLSSIDDAFRFQEVLLEAIRELTQSPGTRSDIANEQLLAVVRVAGNWKIEAASKYLLDLLRHSNPDLRSEAAKALGQMLSDRTTEALIRACSDREIPVRVAALRGLGHALQLSHERPISPNVRTRASALVVESLENGPESVKVAALEVLPHSGVPGVPGLVRLASRSGRTSVQTAAIEAMRALGVHEFVSDLIEILDDRRVRAKAIFGLNETKSPECVEELLDVVKLAWSRRQVGAVVALGMMRADEASSWILALLVRLNSFPNQLLEFFLGAAYRIGFPVDRRGPSCVWAVAAIGGYEALDHLKGLRVHKSKAVRLAAENELRSLEIERELVARFHEGSATGIMQHDLEELVNRSDRFRGYYLPHDLRVLGRQMNFNHRIELERNLRARQSE